MNKITLISMVAAGLALFPAAGAFAAAPDPTPNRESKLLADFENQSTVTSDPTGAGENRASINTDAQFVAEGAKSLQLDLTDVGSWSNNYFVVDLPQPVDISGYKVLSMDVFIPETSIDTSSYYQFDPHPSTANRDDATATTETWYGPVNMHAGWNRMIWTLKNGTDTRISKLAVAGNTGQPYTGPIYVDNIRAYKGSFVGVQPDEKLINGFDNPTDKDAFTGDQSVDINTDKQFLQAGEGSLKIDLTGATSGYTGNFVHADDWGGTVDVSNATAIHIDVFIPEGSYTPSGDWHELGFAVIGENGQVGGATYGLQNVADQWVTLELPLTPDQAKTLGKVKGITFTRNSGNDWAGPIYIDNLRAVVPTPPAAGG